MTLPIALRDTPDGCILPVRVRPGARANIVAGTHGGSLKISLTAPPADGRANQALIAFLAERLGIPRSRIALVTGAASRSKTLRITGLGAAEIQSLLGAVRA